MSIVSTMNKGQFVFNMGDDFSIQASEALFDYYDELSDSMDEPFEFDRVAIRCDWGEYDSLAEAYEQYEPIDEAEATGDDSYRAYFEDGTTLIELDNGHVLVGAF